MWSSAAGAHLLQGSTCCAFRDGILHTLVVTSGCLCYCCLSIISKQSAHSPLTSTRLPLRELELRRTLWGMPSAISSSESCVISQIDGKTSGAGDVMTR